MNGEACRKHHENSLPPNFWYEVRARWSLYRRLSCFICSFLNVSLFFPTTHPSSRTAKDCVAVCFCPSFFRWPFFLINGTFERASHSFIRFIILFYPNISETLIELLHWRPSSIFDFLQYRKPTLFYSLIIYQNAFFNITVEFIGSTSCCFRHR